MADRLFKFRRPADADAPRRRDDAGQRSSQPALGVIKADTLFDSVPVGVIVMWAGDIALGGANWDATGKGIGPMTGWAICNGNNGTQNIQAGYYPAMCSLSPGVQPALGATMLAEVQIANHLATLWNHTHTLNSLTLGSASLNTSGLSVVINGGCSLTHTQTCLWAEGIDTEQGGEGISLWTAGGTGEGTAQQIMTNLSTLSAAAPRSTPPAAHRFP